MEVAELGRLVRSKRMQDGLSIRQAAQDARVSFSTLTRVEDGAQPDLATFMSLCGWLGVDPGRFLSPTTLRAQPPLDVALEHLATDPALSPDAAEQIMSVVRMMYESLAKPAAGQLSPPLAVHLRAATVMRPGVPDRLAVLLRNMRTALEQTSLE